MAGLGPVCVGDDSLVRFGDHGLVETSASRQPGVGGLLDAAAGEQRGSRRCRADPRRSSVSAGRRGGPAQCAASWAVEGCCPRAGVGTGKRQRPLRRQAPADRAGTDALEERQRACSRGCREGAGGREPRQERKHLDRERSRDPRPEAADHEARDAARPRGQAEGERRLRTPARS